MHWGFAGSIFGALLFAACSGEEDRGEKLSFASLPAAERDAMAQLAMGTLEPTLLLLASAELSTGCPSATYSAGARLIYGDCTDASGLRWTGRLEAAGATLYLDDFGFGLAGTAFALDGEIRATEQAIHSDYQVVAGDLTLDLDASWKGSTASGEGARRLGSGSVVELVGVGHADAAGQWDLSAGSGALVLTGRDVLRADFSALDADACAPVTIDGTASGQLCVEAGGFTAARLPSFSAFTAALGRVAAGR